MTIESKHFVLDLSPDNEARFTDPYAWLAKLDRVYEAYADLVGGVPYKGEKIIILETKGIDAWAYAGNPILWNAEHIPAAIEGINQGDWCFGILHEIGHDFDSVHQDGEEYCAWTWSKAGFEHTANFKMVYVLDQIPEAVVWQGEKETPVGKEPVIWQGRLWGANRLPIRLYYQLMAAQEGDYKKIWIWLQEPTNLDTVPSDSKTHHFLWLQSKIGWEPFKAAYRAIRSTPRSQTPLGQDTIGLLRFFVAALANQTDFDVRGFLRERGFPC